MSEMKTKMPVQLILLTCITITLMFVSWLKLANPNFSEISKARQSASFYLDALGKVPISKLGAELHPQVRNQFNVQSLEQFFKQLQLLQPLTVSTLTDEIFQKQNSEWRWSTRIKTSTSSFPLLISVRQPQNQMIGRRWRVFSLCRPDLDLQEEAFRWLSQHPNFGKSKTVKGFQPSPPTNWQFLGSQPLTLNLPGKHPFDPSVILSWKVESNEKLGCQYKLIQSQLRPSTAK